MPSYISKDGKMTPMRERVSYTDANGDPHIYDGPDRAACAYMEEQGIDPKEGYLGMHFSEDSEIIERAHDKHKNIEDFTKQKIYTDKKRNEHFNKNSERVINHKLPERKPYKQKGISGGQNTAGGSGHLKGGFGDGDALSDATASVPVEKK